MSRTVIVIGGAHGGPTAASRARQFNEKARIILVEKSEHVTWVQADLRHHLEGDLTLLDVSLSNKDRYFSKHFNVDVRVNTEATSLDMDSRFVTLRCGGDVERVGFDALVFAGGALSTDIDIDGLHGPYVSHFRNLQDIRKVKKAIANGAQKAVVLGCGFYGIEAAEGLRAAGLTVEVVERAPRILPRFSMPTAQAMMRKLSEQGTKVYLSDHVVAARPKHGIGFELELASKRTLEADLVVVAIGSRPRTKLLADAGAALQKDGSVRVDARMATTLPCVYACGSAVSVPQSITHERIWLPQPSVIERTAQIAGQNAACEVGGYIDTMKPVTSTQMLRVGECWFARTGLTLTESRKHFGDEGVFTTTVHSRTSEAWVDGEDITVSLIIDSESQSIIGGEVWGKSGVSRRIDMISAATLERWSPTKLVDLDMAYAPMLGPAFDPLKEAGTLASLSIAEQTKIISGEKLALWIAEKRPFTLIDVSKQNGARMNGWPQDMRHVPLEELRDRLHEIKNDLPVIVSSRSGRRAFLAHRVLLQLGYNEVYHLDGGELTWSLMMGEVN